MNRMDDILARVAEIKPLPGTVLRLISVINDPDSAVTDIVETIKYDQALTARMLRLCNSAYFGLSRQVQSLEDAMRILGTLKILQLMMAVHTNTLLARGQEGYGLAPGVLWRQSVATAIAATIFAERTHPPNVNLTFTAGLLHDIGKVVLNEHVAGDFMEIVRLVTLRQVSFDEAEKMVLGFSSPEVGAHLAERWQLPEAITRCIRYHRTPSALIPPDVLVDTVYLGNCVCMLCGVGLGADGLCYQADVEVMQRHGLKESDLETAGAQMLVELKRVESVFAESRESPAPVGP